MNPFRAEPSPSVVPPTPEPSEGGWPAPEAAESTVAEPGAVEEPAAVEDDVAVEDDAAVAASSATEAGAPDSVEEVDEVALLDQLESDLAAVETAIASIERIATDSVGGEQAAAEIRAAVSAERFGS